MDKIFITFEQHTKLIDWFGEARKIYKKHLFPLEEGFLILENPIAKESTYLKFKKNDNRVNVVVDFGTTQEWIEFNVELFDSQDEEEPKFTIINSENSNNILQMLDNGTYSKIEEVIVHIVTTLFITMLYMALLEPEFEVKEEPVMNEKRTKKAERHNKYNPNKVIKLTRKVYRLNNPTFKAITKKHYTRIAQAWSVRGHFRNYKSGLKVWVKPHNKGNGALQYKTYKVEVKNEDIKN